MHDILSFLQKGFKISFKFFRIHLGCLGIRSIVHGPVKSFKIHGFSAVIQILLSVQLIVETDVGNSPLLKMLRSQICRGTAA